MATMWKEADCFFARSRGRIWGIAAYRSGTCGLDPSHVGRGERKQKLDDVNYKGQ